MRNKIDRDVLTRYVNGKFTSDDKKYIESIFCSENRKEELGELLKSDWNEFSRHDNLTEYDVDHILHKLYYNIKHQNSTKKKGVVVSLWETYSKVAAVLLLPLVLTYAILSKSEINQIDKEVSFAEINAPLGSRVKFSLPDGSSGWLNSGSTLKYPVVFADSRDVELSGEAYFNIRKNKNKPFNVVASKVNISVLGTQFNVAAYSDDSNVDIVLESGKVKLNHIGSNKFIEMKPNERVVYNSEKITLKKTKVLPEKYSSWKEGKLVFRNDPIEEVAKRLGRWYNIDIVVKQASNGDFRLRATFENEEIEEVMRLLKMTFPIDYIIEKRKKDANGNFERKKIIINLI